ncbi:CLUMA_CG002625, isoform A [Clunio marinus]|uniref:DNA-directed RNA polymerase subunit beta n=1 Tax=Clunio marinus TaxID=568069 RepID=A0A1J1HL88_9DIPT|nr:CLUMA_CG002625, isoform A [Clunio marinus]
MRNNIYRVNSVQKDKTFDQFSHDLTLALEETSRGGAGSRWGIRRRTRSTGNLPCPPQPTEDSSSTDPNDPLNDTNNNDSIAPGNSNSMLSDSDDRQSYALAFKLRQTPMSGNFESDSLNENFSPSKPNIRRKRKFKRMAVEYETTPSTPHTTIHPIFPVSGVVKKRVLKHNQENFRANLFFGKRKRPHRERHADYESYKHSSSVPRQRGGFFSQKDGGISYSEYKSRNRASSMSTARSSAVEKILPLNNCIVSKIEKISQDSQNKLNFSFNSLKSVTSANSFKMGSTTTPIVHFTPSFASGSESVAIFETFKSPPSNEVASSIIREVNETNSALQAKMAHKSDSFESALTNSFSFSKVEHKKKMRHMGNHQADRRNKQKRKLKLQFDDQHFMDCGNINDFLSSSSLSSSDSETEETNESDHEGDDELTDWPGHNEAMVNFASKNEFKRAYKKSTKLSQIKQDDIIQDDDTLMSADEIQVPTIENMTIQMNTTNPQNQQQQLTDTRVPKYNNVPLMKSQASHPINIVGAINDNFMADGSSTSGVVADGGYGSSLAMSCNNKKPIESEMSGETSNHFPNTFGISEIREIRAGCRRIREERPGFSIISSFNEDLLKFLQDEQQKLLKIFDIQEHDKILELAKLYSLNVHTENGCITLKKTSFQHFFFKILETLGAPHISSFDHFLSEGIQTVIANIDPFEFELSNGEKIKIRIENCSIAKPQINQQIDVKERRFFPAEARQRAVTYGGNCLMTLAWTKNDVNQGTLDFDLGQAPIMIRSLACNLNKLTPKEMVEKHEHESDWGGYFVVKGNEKLIRMFLMTRRNYPLSLKRSTWVNRGKFFSEYGILIRTTSLDHTSTNNVLHFLNNGTAKMMFSHKKILSYLPVMLLLKSLMSYTDEKIFNDLMRGYENDLYFKSCVQNMLTELHKENIHTHYDCKNYLGQIFRSRFEKLSPWSTNEEVGEYLIKKTILIHLDNPFDKYNLIVFMVQKLFQIVQGKYRHESADSVMMQELLLGGHLYQKIFKEFLENWMYNLKFNLNKKVQNTSSAQIKSVDVQTAGKYCGNIHRTMEYFLATGNLMSKTGLGLMQNSGLVIVAENINRMRYMSHFRAVHRGSYFVEMRTTDARQLLPDAWGFICPVHTPDGAPCGLLNHLTVDCVASKDIYHRMNLKEIPNVLTEIGMEPIDSELLTDASNYYTILLEGCVVGYVNDNIAKTFTDRLRALKVDGKRIPNTMEIALVPKKENGQFPGLFLFIGAARMMRPVMNLKLNKIEMIGTFEQVYLDVAIKKEEIYPGVTTHLELSQLSFMSNLANLIPMPDNNQSPRNMYQCQMGKQTMGTPCHNWFTQAATKLYRLQTPATPLFRPVHHDNIELDDFAMGTNAIVAVISYTGYDMEDAMILNKSAYERGFAHGSIYHSEFFELEAESYFARDPKNQDLVKYLDSDGFPHPGQKIESGDPICCHYDANESMFIVHKHKGKEMVIVDNVKLLGDSNNAYAPKKACITTRIPRNPTVGDKFASRAGQKGICSQKYPAEDLPFTESGLIPDIIFNPHGFPSRMTIAMMIETMAGKSAAVHGLVHDATPFKFNEENTAINHFGELLMKAGYSYFGTERLYSGVDGRELKAEIFFGVVHYQRLRHMVSDKWQVRSTGPIDTITHQPIKGRKRGGGVRFGEMERDALIAHGASFLLQDRLLHCSDKTVTLICRHCDSLVTPMDRVSKKKSDKSSMVRYRETCGLCKRNDMIDIVEIPYIFKLLVSQLCAMNINIKINYKDLV